MSAHKLFHALSRTFHVDMAYLIKGGAWLGIGYAAVSILKFALVVILAHFLDKTVYGQYQFVMTVIGIVGITGLPRLTLALMQSVARGFDASLITAVRARFTGGLIGSAILLGFAYYFHAIKPEPLWPAFIAAAILFPFYAAAPTPGAYYRGKEQFKHSTLGVIAAELLTVLSATTALFLTKKLLHITLAALAGNIIAWAIIYTFLKPRVRHAKKDRYLVRYGMHLTLMHSLLYLVPFVDKLVIAFFAGFEGLATYAIAMALAVRLSTTGSILQVLILPKLSRAKHYHAALIRKNFRWMLLATILFAAALYALMPWLIPLAFSAKYTDAVLYAQIALLYLIFFIPSRVFHAYFLSRKKTKLLYRYSLSMGALNLALLGALVPFFGILGAVLSKVFLGLAEFFFLGIAFYRGNLTK